MKRTKLKDIIDIIGGKLIFGEGEALIENVVQDSRLVSTGDLFFAIVGENSNGHDFLQMAVDRGARALVISDISYFDESKLKGKAVSIILVKDGKKAFLSLAFWYLDEVKAKMIGVTGSVGKTTTRDLIYSICSRAYKTHKTQGNYNSEIGAALSSLDMKEDSQIAVMEMGMDREGEISSIASYLRPQICVITNIGLSHIERLGSKENIFRAKMEILDYADKNTKLIVYKDEFLNKPRIREYIKAKGLPNIDIIVVGEEADCDIIFSDYRNYEGKGSFYLSDRSGEKREFEIDILGKHNGQNASLAICVAKQLGIDEEIILRGLKNLHITSNRLEIKKVKAITIIDDTYNASPQSMKAALEVLESMQGRKIVVLADMKELGDEAVACHREIGSIAKEVADIVITKGELARHISDDMNFTENEQILEACLELAEEGDIFLFKGSRAMGLDEVCKSLFESLEK